MDSGQHADSKRPSLLRRILVFVIQVALILVCFWALREFVVTPYEIPSGSMETTIMTGDRVFSEKVSYYARPVKPGDIITFPSTEIAGQVLIKRCIAVGGQTVDLVDGSVVIDGVPLVEPYTNGLPSQPLTPAPDVALSYPYTVPAGELWVMGDNRTNSADSRYFGSIKESSVLGRGALVYWPFNHFGLLQ
ncbi:MAG: signal peptidase I [Raoultibacter sp.]